MLYIIFLLPLGLIAFSLLVTSDETRKKLLYAGLFSIVIGHRSIYLGSVTYLVPLEILLIVMFIYTIFGKQKAKRDDYLEVKLPFMLVFVFFWALGYGLIALLNGTNWDHILAWTLTLAVSVPAFWLIRLYIKTPEDLSVTIKILLWVSTIMSILAVIEYRYPAIAQILPQIFSGKYIYTADGFTRATFSFWGYPAGAVIVTWGMLAAFQEALEPSHTLFGKFVYLGIVIVGGYAVYISGQRSSWIGVVCAILLLSLRGRLKGVVGIIGLYVTAGILPAVFWNRFATVTDFAERGVVADSSIGQRINRWTWAWNTTLEKPLGGGYGHWLAHNTFLEISSTIGIFAAIAFFIFFVQLLLRIARTALSDAHPEARRYAWLFLAISITWAIQLNIETSLQTPPLAVAFWPYMALAWYIPDIYKQAQDTEPKADNKKSYRRSFR